MGVGIGWRDEGCTSRGVRKKRHPVGWRFLERATGKAAQRRQWRMQQAAFKAAPAVWRTRMWPPDGWRNGEITEVLPAADKAR